MPIYRLSAKEVTLFPPPEDADPSGLVAVGGDLRPERLVAAYAQGIFPWYNEGQPILWHSPDPRFVIPADGLHVPRSLKKTLRRAPYTLRLDTAFDEVMVGCAQTKRPTQAGTWITSNMRAAYGRMHALGFAHSAEAWVGETLVGGLYGVSLGKVFFGESMFARAVDASKVAFVTMATLLFQRGFQLIDCQTETEHLVRFGAQPWPRERFLAQLALALEHPTERGAWTEWLPERAP